MDEDVIRRQFVVFANFRNKVEEFSTLLKAYLDLKGHTGEVITVVGTHYKEQKMHHAALFFNDTPDRSRPVIATCSTGCLFFCQAPCQTSICKREVTQT
jgi:hypothetical protein